MSYLFAFPYCSWDSQGIPAALSGTPPGLSQALLHSLEGPCSLGKSRAGSKVILRVCSEPLPSGGQGAGCVHVSGQVPSPPPHC